MWQTQTIKAIVRIASMSAILVSILQVQFMMSTSDDMSILSAVATMQLSSLSPSSSPSINNDTTSPVAVHNATSQEPDVRVPSSDGHVVDNNDPCSVAHWQQELAHEDELLQDIKPQDVGFFHVTFSIQGNAHAEAEDRSVNETTKSHDRTREMNASIACLKKAFPKQPAPYQLFELGDYPSFHAGITAFHKWAANSSPHAANFVIDTDIVANPASREISLEVVARELHNVDLSLAHNPYQQLSKPKLQDSIQTAIVGYRNNKRMQLFHTCVAHTMDQALAMQEAEEAAAAAVNNTASSSGSEQQSKKPNQHKHEQVKKKKKLIRQQEAMAKVLQSPVGQFVRVRWYSPEFFCSDRKSSKLEHYMVYKKKGKVRDTPCLFIHSHDVARQHNLCNS